MAGKPRHAQYLPHSADARERGFLPWCVCQNHRDYVMFSVRATCRLPSPAHRERASRWSAPGLGAEPLRVGSSHQACSTALEMPPGGSGGAVTGWARGERSGRLKRREEEMLSPRAQGDRGGRGDTPLSRPGWLVHAQPVSRRVDSPGRCGLRPCPNGSTSLPAPWARRSPHGPAEARAATRYDARYARYCAAWSRGLIAKGSARGFFAHQCSQHPTALRSRCSRPPAGMGRITLARAGRSRRRV